MKAVLFDLDGTLLPTAFEDLIPEYVGMLGTYLGRWGDPRWLAQEIIQATDAMIRGSDGQKVNLDTFADHFFASTGLDRSIWQEFDRFYEEEFPKLGVKTTQNPQARQVVETAFARGWKVVIATNPLFPARAIHERMQWAGVADFPYDWITTGENMHYCKPHPEYYLEVAGRIGVEPEHCLMVGDDPAQDGPAAAAGMQLLLLNGDVSLAHAAHILAGRD